jgi:hypothetical protein
MFEINYLFTLAASLVASLPVQRTTSPGLTIEWSDMLAFLGLQLHL